MSLVRLPVADAPEEPAAVLAPPRGKGHASVVRLPDHWFIACMSRELRRGVLPRTILGTPMALFRDAQGKPAALLDRCPHRNVPLSLGEVVSDGTLQCAYHGWRFGGDGACRFIPSSTGEPAAKARRAPSFPTIEQDGYVWVYATPGEMPETRPHRFEFAEAPGYTTVRQVVASSATMYSTLENALDVPHTAFLHRGLFRSKSRGIEITARVRREADRVEAEYIGEPRPPGLVARILSPSGGVVTHFDRFILPSIAQVEYRIGTENHLLVDSVMTPVSDFETRIYAAVSFRLRFPGWLVRPFVKPLALRIFQQDAFILAKQTEVIQRFGGEQFASTDIDVLGRHIWRLLKAAERGDTHGDGETNEVRLVV
jgi:phenylpropionate dioxygenase-like ring-hydroxylating dioxygenase large terminal subunit